MSEPDSQALPARLGETVQALVEPDPIFKPDAVYFDTNPLIAAGWPNASAQLLSVMQLIERLEIQMCLPETVQQELEEHQIRELGEHWSRINSQIEKLTGKTESFLPVQQLPPLPSRENLRAGLRKLASGLTGRFVSVPVTKRPLSEFLNLAITRRATFKEGGQGFQDAVILCTVLDHMTASGQHNACLVSRDAAFQSDGTQELAKATGVTLKVLGDLNDLAKLLERNLTSLAMAQLAREQKIWQAALEGRFGELQAFLTDKLEIDPSEIEVFGTVKRLLAVKVLTIEKAHTPLDAIDAAMRWLSVFAEVKVILTLEVDKYYSGEPDKLKVGSSVYSVDWRLRGLTTREVITQDATVYVEAEAFRNEGGYSEVRFTSVGLVGKSLRPLLGVFKEKR